MTARVEVYATQSCPYCIAARALLRGKGVEYELIDVGREPARRAEMTQRANGRRTVPQIFIDGVGVGGSDDIHALDRQGKLDPMLGL
ncbi:MULTISPECIES: glutaredoxin 3 [Paracoccus]|uniref:Glutaredoxin n=1 Tax=Paracoccus solventivorans TaxID=53463 RepID=A0A832PNK7_9RHOB|nr:glutaredoxin 3 [Paracoccus solventivorans]HHW34212.1 glutaredoxin 3 [Paracoccus solventivorans]HMM08680.1 glutaredoxin 3 [Paracoccus solventivorans]